MHFEYQNNNNFIHSNKGHDWKWPPADGDLMLFEIWSMPQWTWMDGRWAYKPCILLTTTTGRISCADEHHKLQHFIDDILNGILGHRKTWHKLQIYIHLIISLNDTIRHKSLDLITKKSEWAFPNYRYIDAQWVWRKNWRDFFQRFCVTIGIKGKYNV